MLRTHPYRRLGTTHPEAGTPPGIIPYNHTLTKTYCRGMGLTLQGVRREAKAHKRFEMPWPFNEYKMSPCMARSLRASNRACTEWRVKVTEQLYSGLHILAQEQQICRKELCLNSCLVHHCRHFLTAFAPESCHFGPSGTILDWLAGLLHCSDQFLGQRT